jgi:hypothetical protein
LMRTKLVISVYSFLLALPPIDAAAAVLRRAFSSPHIFVASFLHLLHLFG